MTTFTRGIYRFFWDCGRQGEVSGIFSAEASDIVDNLGKGVYFGEILGKHSEVYGTLGAKDCVLVSENPSDVEVFDRLKLSNGYNPLHYISSNEDEE